MALTDYIFKLSYFHIGQLAQKTQNLQKWCVHVLKTPILAVSLHLTFYHFLVYTEAVPNSHWDYKWTADLWLCSWVNAVLKKGRKKPSLRIPEVIFPLFYFLKKYFFSDSEIKTMFCFSSNWFSITHTCTSGSFNSTSAKHTGEDEHASLII